MEQLSVFYRIFHADLSPDIAPTLTQKKAYKEFLNHYSGVPGYPIFKEIALLPDYLLRFHYYELLLHKIVKEIEVELYQKVFVRGENEQKMKSEVIKLQRYIGMHLIKIRRDFIPLAEHQNILHCSEAKNEVDIYKLVYRSFVDLHEYLEATFRHYLDEHIVVPCKKRKRFVEEERPKAELILDAMNTFDINSKLKEQVNGTIERFLSDGFNGFTYVQMHYCSKFNKELNEFFKKPLPLDEKDFILLLIQINFNRNGVLQYIFAFLTVQLEQKENHCKRLELLSFYLKSINRIQHSSSFAYNEKLFSLKEQLSDWLEEKIQDTSLEDIKVKNPIGMKPEKYTPPIKKYQVNFSVPESALLLRALKNTGIVDMPKEELFEYFSTHFYTKQAPNVSTSSLGKKYHDPSEKNLRTVREAFNRCLSYLDELEKKQLR